jgi:hypothetical protein
MVHVEMVRHEALDLLVEIPSMQRLNIPLSRHTKTTRRNRRVVWLLMIALLGFVFLVWQAGTVWYGRDAILAMAPSDTVLALQLQITPSTLPFLDEWLRGVPLISQRSLDLADILKYAHGEIALFVTKDGNRSLAIRSKESLPEDLLDAYSISSEQQSSFLLLSNTLLPIAGTQAYSRRSILPSVRTTWLGRIVLPDEEFGGNLFINEGEILAEFSRRNAHTQIHPLIEDLVLGLYGISGENPEFAVLQDGSMFPALLEENTPMNVVIRFSESESQTLLIVEDVQLEEQDVIRELQIIGSFAKPSIIESRLPDGSLIQEIELQPDVVSVEEVSTGLGVGYRVLAASGSSIIGLVHDGSLFLSNSEILLNDYASEGNADNADYCSGRIGFINTEFLLSQVSLQHLDPEFSFLSQFFRIFSGISIEVNPYSTKLRLCKT